MGAAVTLCLMSVAVPSVLANANIQIRDDAGILTASDRKAVTDIVQPATFGVVIWTVADGYAGREEAFVAAADAVMGSNQAVIAIDPTDHYEHVAARQNSGLTPDDSRAATNAARADFDMGRWGNGIVTVLTTLVTAPPSPVTDPGGTRPAEGGFPWAALAIVPVAGLLILVLVRRARASRGSW
jgi:hypothetical protein